ncbi:hypothetical protein RTG_03232 [Rhodotorula toruloides ATCC 204091]|uniref:Uncharacterized protein n=1 Tax=Rhodotorula toruloides TaxID=5286 RepID=A0A0K3CLR9_RHOTO|nr:hypothetical protein RTG_03232 [Rhodotorula toruloides ATCC 204091]KAK4330798.1 hypothetical protein RTBOTA2_006461 [Rhodotorula toruloides]PRQ70614.1 hypothetical protein AAT19DRAFT_10771 [Rhodotorula toruloides]
MPQSFKSKPPANAHKAKSSTQKKSQPKDPKKGARTIPPKKANLVTKQQVHRRTTSSHASALEKEIAAQAMSHGKLTIMRKAAEEVKAREEKAKK